MMYTRAGGLRSLGLRFIGDYDFKPPRQILPIDSNANLPCDSNFLYRFDILAITA